MQDGEAYDYIIVGAGSAGCLLANRLSADPKTSVCLLEAGPRDWNPFIHIPLGVIAMMWGKTFNWGYWTKPQKNMNNRPMFWPRGRTLGGSSSVNAMCYTRGHPSDYDDWKEQGNDGWGYEDLLPHFKAVQNFEGGPSDLHGTGGGYNVAEPRYVNPLAAVFLNAAAECGYDAETDFSGIADEGFGYYRVAQKDGRRCSNADAFLHPIEDRPNLTVYTRARVHRVRLQDKRAVGVTVRRGRWGTPVDLHANREVVLSGGAINSPQLLQLSGIGPREELEAHGIKVEHELPGVGRNLQDHLDISVIHREKTRLSLSLNLRWLFTVGLKALWQYFCGGRRGPLSSNIAETGGFAKLASEDQRPRLQFHFIACIEEGHGHDLWNTFKYHGYTLRICDLHPYSRGQVGLNSADPEADARIDPNYLDDERDLDTMVAAVKLGRRLLDSRAFAPHKRDELEPGMAVESDDQIRAFIRAQAESIYHPVGTCKMGNDEQAVVDASLRVHGIEGLRVVDASIMPSLNGSNTNAPTTAIAEKAAKIMLAEQEEQAAASEAA